MVTIRIKGDTEEEVALARILMMVLLPEMLWSTPRLSEKEDKEPAYFSYSSPRQKDYKPVPVNFALKFVEIYRRIKKALEEMAKEEGKAKPKPAKALPKAPAAAARKAAAAGQIAGKSKKKKPARAGRKK